MRLIGSKRGIGLIDVMITLFLLAIAGMIFSATFPTCFRATKQSQEYKIAAALTQKKMEQLRCESYELLTYTQLLSASVIDSTPNSSPYSFTNVDTLTSLLTSGTGTIKIEDISTDTRKVTVTISWKGTGAAMRSMQTVTLFVDKRTRKMI